MRIAVLGATSQIAADLIILFAAQTSHELFLFARRPGTVSQWLVHRGLSGRCVVCHIDSFGLHTEYDLILNCIGAGNPSKISSMGASILDITYKYDALVLEYLGVYESSRYIFLSSGASYGSVFRKPADQHTPATIPVNSLQSHYWYGVAKLYAECRHRSRPHLLIVDIRIFNYFSHTQDLSPGFLITDIVQAIRSGHTLQTTPVNIKRDYISMFDLFALILLLLDADPVNDVIDCYSLAPVDKMSLLAKVRTCFGLSYELSLAPGFHGATGDKINYFSINRKAKSYGYQPTRTSLDNIVSELSYLVPPISTLDVFHGDS